MPELKHVGRSETRIDGLEKVTGAATFVDDMRRSTRPRPRMSRASSGS